MRSRAAVRPVRATPGGRPQPPAPAPGPSPRLRLRPLSHEPHPRAAPSASAPPRIRSEAQRGARRKGMLADERVDYLDAIGFEWEGLGATAGGGGGGGGSVASWYDAGKRLGK